MALTNAQRQARWQARRREELKRLRLQVADASASRQPGTALVAVQSLPRAEMEEPRNLPAVNARPRQSMRACGGVAGTGFHQLGRNLDDNPQRARDRMDKLAQANRMLAAGYDDLNRRLAVVEKDRAEQLTFERAKENFLMAINGMRPKPGRRFR